MEKVDTRSTGSEYGSFITLLFHYSHSKHEVFLVLLVKFHACFPYFAFYNFEVLFVFFTSQVRQSFGPGVLLLLLNHYTAEIFTRG